MDKAVRIVAGLPGVIMIVSGLRWLIDPAAAAAEIGMPLLEDATARSSQIGDLGAFFLAAGVMILLGVIRRQAVWLHAGALLVGGAAVCRTLAWMFQGAAFVAPLIAVEAVMASLLLFAAWRFGVDERADTAPN
jgi:hypothetical protein